MTRPDRITYVGHATVLLELGGMRLLTDPVLGRRILGFIRRHAAEPDPEVGEGIDGVLISHLHHDHLDFPTLRRIGRDVPVFVPAGAGRTLRRHGFSEVTEVGAAETVKLGGVNITATPAIHNARRYKFGPRVAAAGYVVDGERRVYFAGDTDLFQGMAAIGGDLDAALLPIAGWGPSVGTGHLDWRRAAEAAAMLRPRVAIPIHWGTMLRFDLGRRASEILEQPPRRFAAQVAERAPGVRAVVLEPGESFDFSPA
jgi:L-ascorbate metabolism protein UlaG (beta-lactamase superfamily)